MNRDKIENIVNSIIFTIEKFLLFSPRTDKFVEVYLNFLFYLIRRYRLFTKMDIYLNFIMQTNRYSKNQVKRLIRWILNMVIPDIDDDYYRSRIYYCIAKSFLSLKQYNKAQNFAIKAMKYFQNVFESNNFIHLLYYFELSLLIAKLAFYRRKYILAYNFIQYLLGKIADTKTEFLLERNMIYLFLESSLWLILSHIYVNKDKWDYKSIKEVIDHFTEMVSTYRNYIDITKIKESVSSILLKNIKRLINKNQPKVSRRRKKDYNLLISIVSELYSRMDNIPNTGKLLLSLYRDYVIKYMCLYPDNYKAASRLIMRSIYLNHYYINSYNLFALSKFLLFKIMNIQKIYTDLGEYMSKVDIQEYILSSDELSEEVKKDIANTKIVHI
ncbi:MAG: hypothetical protein RMJ51_04965 [Candidatus Calescibacterium sp.]|nr:hypothetical protein [Candidatus Calescibacterium sp.]MCX7972537.1 hypothetical protein [bacterium]MDW8195570.1 hypothetical protein [Candidatus Calescibacterium sp.]